MTRPSAQRTAGFTLVEGIVAMAILAIVLVLVGGILMSTSRVLNQQQLESASDTIVATVGDAAQSVLVGAEPSTVHLVHETDGTTSVFFVTKATDNSHPAGSYKLFVKDADDGAGQGGLWIARVGNADTSPSSIAQAEAVLPSTVDADQTTSLVPAPTYTAQGATTVCTLSKDDDNDDPTLTISVRDKQGNNVRSATVPLLQLPSEGA
jgi:type II secretory pathway pseudopilin PulG